MNIKKDKKILGIIGQPVRQSLSPVIHNFWLKTNKVSGIYRKFMVKKGEVGKFLSRKVNKDCFLGLNVTVPHKIDILEHLDYLDISAKMTGSVNTVKLEKDGSLKGYNTDLYGFVAPLKLKIPAWKKYIDKVVVYGSGGSARAVCAGLKKMGAKKIIVCGRTMKNSQALKDLIGGRIKIHKWSDRSLVLERATLLVNTTPMGMLNSASVDTNLELLPKMSIVYDIVYNPIKTGLILQAEARGNKTVEGVGMLLHQARYSFHRWFNIWPKDMTYLENKLKKILKR